MSRRAGHAVTAACVLLAIAATTAAFLRPHGAPGQRAAAHPARQGTGHPGRKTHAGRPSLPYLTLAGLRWHDFHGVLLPESPSAGPRHQGRGLASGYADTPLGAVIAAVNIAVRATPQFGPAVFRPTISRQVTGRAAPALLRACATAYRQAARAAHVTGGRPLPQAYVIEQAFRFRSWSPARAVLDIVSAGPGPGGVTVRAATRVQITWLRGDWRLAAPPRGEWAAAAAVVRSLSAFTEFPLPSGG